MKILNETNHGSTQNVELGQSFRVELTVNPTSGYIWEITKIDEDILKLLSEDQVKYTQEKIGLGGLMIFVFEAARPGNVELEIIYRKTWDPNSVLNRFFIEVNVA